MFAPMWNFYDIGREGTLTASCIKYHFKTFPVGNLIYQTFSSSNPLANDVFNDVNNFIRVTRDVTSYSGIWMLLMEWKGVHPYPHSFSNDTFLERVRKHKICHFWCFILVEQHIPGHTYYWWLKHLCHIHIQVWWYNVGQLLQTIYCWL